MALTRILHPIGVRRFAASECRRRSQWTKGANEILDPLTQGNVVRDRKLIVYSLGADKRVGGGDDLKTW